MEQQSQQLGLAGRIANQLMDSPLVPLFVVACLLLGGYGLLTPREDRPDIDVPTALISIPWPGGGAERIDEQLARRSGAWVRQLSSVTEVRSSSSSHAALLVVEFAAGTSETTAYAELQELFGSHADHLPVGAGPVRIETTSEQRLAVLVVTISSGRLSPRELDQIAGEVAAWLGSVSGVRGIVRHGGQKRTIEVLPRPEAMAAYGIHLHLIARAISGSARTVPLGTLAHAPVTMAQAGTDISSLEKLARLPVGRDQSGPVYLEDLADIRDGDLGATQAVLHWRRDHSGDAPSVASPAVSLAVTTISGENVSDVTRRVTARLQELQRELVPDDAHVSITYDAGKDSTERVYRVLRQLLSATLVVVGIIWLGLGWRPAVIIALMMPTSLAIVPFVYNRFDFTLNPVSIAAMILAIGILSDDAVVMLENIARLFRKAGERSRELTVKAVNEVGNPTILADILVVATLLPTAAITGEMGQYIRAIPVGASVAVLFSLLVALSITPYFGFRLLRAPGSGTLDNTAAQDRQDTEETGAVRAYRAVIGPFIAHGLLRWMLYAVLLLCLLASFALVGLRVVQIGLTPLLDRRMFGVEVELPAGAPLAATLSATSTLEMHLRDMEEIRSVTTYVGTRAPLISPPATMPVPEDIQPHQARLHVQLVPSQERDRLSYDVSREIARQLVDWLAPFQATWSISRIPSGPSNDRDVTAEIFGGDMQTRQSMADRLQGWFRDHPDVLVTQQFPRPALELLDLSVDPQRAATFGVNPAEVTRTLLLAVKGQAVTDMRQAASRDPIPVVMRLDEDRRGDPDALRALYVHNLEGVPVSLEDLADFTSLPGEPIRFRRDLLPVLTVVADLDRSRLQPVTLQFDASREVLEKAGDAAVSVSWLAGPQAPSHPVISWAGEWEMTRDVYRDLGAAGLVVMLVVYVLLAGWFGSYILPLLIMLPIPLIFIGVLPAHWIWGINIAGTGVLGVIALAGIVTRNSILLVDFIRQREEDGMATREAVIQAGAQRTRPIVLTAATVMFGSGVLIFEPSLEPLGLTLASGVLISVPLTLLLIPLLYYHLYGSLRNKEGEQGGQA
jgi:multidrug efflux pump subunit AcrB